jgi:thioredoxin-related protein
MQYARLLFATVALTFNACSPAGAAEARAFNPSPHAIDIPSWFQDTFLDLPDDIREAARAGKRVMIYFGQDGCPYCRELMRANFSDKRIAEKTRRHFVPIAMNIWGDREVRGIDGKQHTEKAFATQLKVQFTPTLVFFDEKGGIALRLNGYYPPHQFHAALDYVIGRQERKIAFAEFLRRHAQEPASGTLHQQPFFMRPPYDLDRTRNAAAKPLAVVLEQKHCAACDEMHATGFNDRAARTLIDRFDVVRLELFGAQPVVTPAGKRLSEEAWGRELKIAYTPTIVFFDTRGQEAFRVEAYLRPFHFISSFDYVASGAYRKEPNFQRYLQARAEKIRAEGGRVELW